MGKIEVLCKEYDAVRSEILAGLSARYTILSIGITAVGIMCTVAGALHKMGDGAVTTIIFVVAVPAIITSIGLIWFGEYCRVQKAGARLTYFESRINAEARQQFNTQEDLLILETATRKAREAKPYRFDPVLVGLGVIAILSVFIGRSISNDHGVRPGLLWLPAIGLMYWLAVRSMRRRRVERWEPPPI